jgi:hypothetical protein
MSKAARAKLEASFGRLPLAFEKNLGQVDPKARFVAHGRGGSVFLTSTSSVFSLAGGASQHLRERHSDIPPSLPPARPNDTVFQIKLVGAAAAVEPEGLDLLPGKCNYFIGNDPAKWRTNVPTFAKVKFPGVYPGVDLVYYGNQRQLEYDFVVAPGAKADNIHVAFEGVDRLQVNREGDLVLTVAGGEVVQHRPRVYEQDGNRQRELNATYVLRDKNEVAFRVTGRDSRRQLVIDPDVSYSTYLGGEQDDNGNGIALDSSGNAYVTGQTGSSKFPTMNPGQPTNHGYPLGWNAFVSKLTADGTGLVYSTFLGGSQTGFDIGWAIAVDSSGSAYVTGVTTSTDFPTKSPLPLPNPGGYDAFVTKLTPDGSRLVYSSHLGGSGVDWGRGIAVDGAGNAYVTGYTFSADFPIVKPYQGANHGSADVFVAKIKPGGGDFLFSTFLGGSGDDRAYAIALDSAGNAYVTGYTFSTTDFPTKNPILGQEANHGGADAFVTKLFADGHDLAYSTYLGGSDDDSGYGIAVDGTNNAYMTGKTFSLNFPLQGPFQSTNHGVPDAFVTKLTAAGSTLAYSTYLGGSGADFGEGIGVDSAGSAYVIGTTNSSNFPAVNPVLPAYRGGYDIFAVELTVDGSDKVYSTTLGGSGDDFGNSIAVAGPGRVYLTGYTQSIDLPVGSAASDGQPPVQSALRGLQNAFVIRLDGGGACNPSGHCPICPRGFHCCLNATDCRYQCVNHPCF